MTGAPKIPPPPRRGLADALDAPQPPDVLVETDRDAALRTHAYRHGQVVLDDGRTVTLVGWNGGDWMKVRWDRTDGAPKHFRLPKTALVRVIDPPTNEVTVLVTLKMKPGRLHPLSDRTTRDDFVGSVRRGLEDQGFDIGLIRFPPEANRATS